MICQNLQRDDGHHRAEHPGCLGYPQDMIGHLLHQFVPLGCDGDHDPAARLGLLDLAESSSRARDLGRKTQNRHLLVDQGDRAVLHLAGRVALGVDIGNFLELQAPS